MIAKIEQSLKKGGNKNVTTKVFPGAEHDLTLQGQKKACLLPGFIQLW